MYNEVFFQASSLSSSSSLIMTHFTVAPASRIHATINLWHSARAFHHDVQLHRPRHQSLRPLQIKFHLRQIGNILICGEVHGGIDQTWKRFNMSLFHRVDTLVFTCISSTRFNLVIWNASFPLYEASLIPMEDFSKTHGFGLASYHPNILDISSLPLDADKEPMNINRKRGQPLSTPGSRAAFFGKP